MIPLQKLLLRKTLWLVLLSVFLVGTTVGYIAWRSQINTIASGLKNIAQQASNSIEAYLNQTLDILQTAIEYTGSRQVPQDQMDYYFETLVRNNPNHFEEITLLQTDGMEIASSRPDRKILDRSDELASVEFSGQKEIISDVYLETGKQIPIVKILVPVYRHGKMTGILLSKVSLRGFWHLFDPTMPGGISFGNTGRGVLVDQSFVIIGHADLQKVFEQETLPVDWSPQQPEEYTFTDIGTTFASASYIDTARWWLIVMMDKREAYAGATKSLIYSLLITIVLALILWYSTKPVSAKISAPIKELSQGTRKVAHGDFSVQLDLNSNIQEVTDLTSHFNQMASELQVTLDKLRRADRLAALGTMASVVAHEIRNPLSSIVSLSLPLKKQVDRGNLDFLHEFDEVVPNELRRLNGILDEFLDFARPRPPELDWKDINELLSDTVYFFEAGITEKNVKVRFNPAPDIPLLKMDEKKIRQVILNLVKNAYEALSEEGGEITCSIQFDDSQRTPCVHVRIQDNGSGIPDEIKNQLFEPFATTKRRGSGLGLAICHRIIEEHNATIEVESTNEYGTTFKITFPITEKQIA